MSASEIEPLSIDRDITDSNGDGSSSHNEEETRVPLDVRILQLVKNAPNRTIRPALVAAELGISVTDAAAELCGLLAAVGGGQDGASFTFETLEGGGGSSKNKQHIMVFSFPPDFEQRALRKRRRQNRRELAHALLKVGVKFLKTLTAFGLILSLLIVAVAAVAAMIAAIVAMSNQQGNHRQRNHIVLQLRLLFLTMRDMLWCYAVFGPNEEQQNQHHEGGGQDPFFREVAYDLFLIFSVCCGNPGSIFFWMRANQLSHRRRHRGWVFGQRTMESDVPGVMLVRNGDWQTDEAPPPPPTSHRGLLSTAVEYLFGPHENVAAVLEAEYWKLRAAVIIELSAPGVSLRQLAPYVDSPPPANTSAQNASDNAIVIEQGLRIVTYFNGIPETKGDDSTNDGMVLARFIFPELVSESSAVTRYQATPDLDDGTWSSLLYVKEELRSSMPSNSELPSFLKEKRRRFSSLTFQQLSHCLVLGSLNFWGVVFFHQAMAKGGVLELPAKHPLEWFFHGLLLPTLRFYAVLFFALPMGRLVILYFLNKSVDTRNSRRENLSTGQ